MHTDILVLYDLDWKRNKPYIFTTTLDMDCDYLDFIPSWTSNKQKYNDLQFYLSQKKNIASLNYD